jgi:sarcosine oxidase
MPGRSLERRELLIAAGAALGAAGILASRARAAQKSVAPRTGSELKVIVVGAGAMGGWTALALAEGGARVMLVDAYGPGNLRAASSDQSRMIRADYANPLYARMALDAYARLSEREKQWGETLLVPTGKLLFAKADKRQEIDQLERTLSIVGITGTERLSTQDLRQRWPQIDFAGIDTGLFTPGGAGASTILAEHTTRRVAKAFREAGGHVAIGQARTPVRDGGGIAVPLSSGETLKGDVAVYACGAWMAKLFPDIIGRHVVVERRDVFYFGTPPGDARFSYPGLPAWDLLGGGFYGFPDFEGGGFKVAPYPDRNAIDPDSDDRRPNDYVVERARGFLRQRFPALGDQPLLGARVCQVAYTKTEDFIIDRHPELEKVWLIGGDSGHAFKHGPAIGHEMARRILTGAGDPDYASAFRMPA